jgi:hypothetical protein
MVDTRDARGSGKAFTMGNSRLRLSRLLSGVGVAALVLVAAVILPGRASRRTVVVSAALGKDAPVIEHVHSAGGGAQKGSEAVGLPAIMPREQEMALAESAGPPGVAKAASIYVLERGTGYAVARQGTNGFACLVNRDRADTLEPECFDPEGAESILPVVLEGARLREQGVAAAEIDRRIAEGFQSGKYRAPRRGGVTYMLSKENKVFNGRRVISYPPHVMIFAPYVKNADIGADFKNPWMPWVLGEGTPHAYIMVVVRETEAAVRGGG